MADESPLDELYREVILDHARHPHNFGTLAQPDVASDGSNPVCGDEVALQLAFDGERVRAARFRGSGCSISQASASMLTDAVMGLTADGLASLIPKVEGLLRGEARGRLSLGDLEALQGVARFPARVKCAVLPWKVLRRALAVRAGAPDPEDTTIPVPRPVPGRPSAAAASPRSAWQPPPSPARG